MCVCVCVCVCMSVFVCVCIMCGEVAAEIHVGIQAARTLNCLCNHKWLPPFPLLLLQGANELDPASNKSHQNTLFGSNSGATIIDALDTLYIMGMHDELSDAKDWVRTKLNMDVDKKGSVFELSIRYDTVSTPVSRSFSLSAVCNPQDY